MKVFAQPLRPEAKTTPARLRMLIESLVFGWFIPGNKRYIDAASGEPDAEDTSTPDTE